VKDTTIAGRYARALFILTEKRGETERALEDLQGLAGMRRADPRLARLLATPQVLLEDKRQVTRAVLKGRVQPAVELFVDLLLRKGRLRELDMIAAEFESLVEKKQGVRRAEVVSAVPLTDAELGRLHAELERTMRLEIKLASAVDPDLVGGAYVRIGDRVIDRSVRTLLEAITERLMQVSV
jgi:F-type H+-transporting ATPase subunit delta